MFKLIKSAVKKAYEGVRDRFSSDNTFELPSANNSYVLDSSSDGSAPGRAQLSKLLNYCATGSERKENWGRKPFSGSSNGIERILVDGLSLAREIDDSNKMAGLRSTLRRFYQNSEDIKQAMMDVYGKNAQQEINNFSERLIGKANDIRNAYTKNEFEDMAALFEKVSDAFAPSYLSNGMKRSSHSPMGRHQRDGSGSKQVPYSGDSDLVGA